MSQELFDRLKAAASEQERTLIVTLEALDGLPRLEREALSAKRFGLPLSHIGSMPTFSPLCWTLLFPMRKSFIANYRRTLS